MFSNTPESNHYHHNILITINMGNKLFAVTFLDDLVTDGRAQIVFNRREEDINRTPKFRAVDAPLSTKGQQQTEKDLLKVAQSQEPTRTLAVGNDEQLKYGEVYIYDTAIWKEVKEVRPEIGESYGKFRQLVRV